MCALHFFFQFLLITDMVNLTTKNNHHIVQLANYEVIRVTSQEHGPLKFRLTTKKSIPAHALVKSWTSEQSHIHTIIYLLYNSVVGKRSPKDPMKALWELWASWASILPLHIDELSLQHYLVVITAALFSDGYGHFQPGEDRYSTTLFHIECHRL